MPCDVRRHIELIGAKPNIRLQFRKKVMNVHDNLKGMAVEEIKDFYTHNSISAAIAMSHVSGDFNLGNVIRSANFFGFKEVFYVGGKKGYDRRSTVGTHHYIPVHFMKTEEEFLSEIVGKYALVCVENNIPRYSRKTISIFDEEAFHGLYAPPVFLFGEEQLGISDALLEKCQYIITIPAFGSVRSINVGSCASAVMAMFRNKIKNRV